MAKTDADKRRERLAAALRENLKRRKAGRRSKAAAASAETTPETPEGDARPRPKTPG